MMPSLVWMGRPTQPENQASMESSYSSTCARTSQITSSPWCVCSFTAMVFPMVPVGTNSAASFPAMAAARLSNRFTVGSSP